MAEESAAAAVAAPTKEDAQGAEMTFDVGAESGGPADSVGDKAAVSENGEGALAVGGDGEAVTEAKVNATAAVSPPDVTPPANSQKTSSTAVLAPTADVKGCEPFDLNQVITAQGDKRPATFIVTGPPGCRKKQVAEEFALYRRCAHISAAAVLDLAVAAVEIENAKREQEEAKQARAARRAAREAAGEEAVPEDEEDDDNENEDEEEEEEDDEEEGETGRPKPLPVEPFVVSEEAIRAYDLLVAGNAVPMELTLELIRQHIASPSVQHRGYVLEAFHDTEATSDPEVAAKAVEALHSFSIVPEYHLELVATPEDRVNRVVARRTDPVTGKHLLLEMVADDVDEDEEDEEEDEEEEEDEDDEEEEEDKDPVEEPPELPAVSSVPTVSRLDYGAAIVTPEDSDVSAELNLGAGALEETTGVSEVARAYAKTFLGPYSLRLDDTVELSETVAALLFMLERRSIPPIKEAMVLDAAEEDANIMTAFRAANLPEAEDGEVPLWNLSRFGQYCPVSMKDQGKAVLGIATCGVMYDGYVYALASPKELAIFKICPSAYVYRPLGVGCRVIIISHPYTPGPELSPTVVELPEITPGAPLDDAALASVKAAVEAAGTEWVVPSVPPEIAHALINELGSTLCCVVATDSTHGLAETAASSYSARVVMAPLQPTEDIGEEPAPPEPVTAEMLKRCLSASLGPVPSDEAHEVDLPTPHPSPYEEGPDLGYGEFRHYCPVTLQEDGVLRPGVAETAAQYQNVWYEMATEEYRQAFVSDPSAYISADKPPVAPPPRFVFLGPSHSGKSVNARRLARRHRLFHISFMEYIRELAMNPASPYHEAAAAFTGEEKIDMEPETTMSIIRTFWKEEPYCSAGIILEGFPRNEEDARLMMEAGLVPDAVVVLTMSSQVGVQRIMPKLMDKFTTARNFELAKRAKKNAEHLAKLVAHKKEWEDSVAKARAEKEAERERIFREGGGDDDDEEEEEEEDEEPEYEEPDWAEQEEEEELETVADAQERFEGEITEAHESASEDANFVLEFLTGDDHRLKPVTVDATRREAGVRRAVDQGLAPFLERREHLFAYPRVISYSGAVTLLERGLVRQSAFGNWCPVSLSHKSTGLPILGGRYPVIFRGAVYFMASHALRKKFVDEPYRFGPQAQSGQPPLVAVSVALLGGPGGGRTDLAKRLCQDLDCVHLNPEATVETLLADTPNCALAIQVREILETGGAIPDSLIVATLQQALLSAKAQSNGFVLDGFPQTLEHVKLLEEAGIRPRCVFQLVNGTDSGPVSDEWPDAGEARRRTYEENTPNVLKWYSDEFNCTTELDGSRSLWWLATRAAEVITEQLYCEQAFVGARLRGIPAPVSQVGFSTTEINKALSTLGLYCPVRLLDRQELVKSEAGDARFTVVFKDVFYKFADAEALSTFTRNPDKYISQSLPKHLPHLRSADDVRWAFPKPVKWGGFCPVTYAEQGRRFSALKQGSNDLAVEYTDGFYVFANKDAREKFMRKPDVFASIPLPDRLPPKLEPVDPSRLPHLGYMEQTVSLLVTKACAACGLAKPKYPYLTVDQSAAVFIALYLRAHNPKSSAYARQEARKRLKAFEQKCQLVRYLGQNIQPNSDVMTERPFDFRYKMEEFMALKQSS